MKYFKCITRSRDIAYKNRFLRKHSRRHKFRLLALFMPEMFGKRERDKSQRAHSGLKNRVSRQAPICQEGLRLPLNGNKRKAHPSWHSEATMP